MAQACLVANEAEGGWHIRNKGRCTMLHACASILPLSPDIACAPALLRSGSRFQAPACVLSATWMVEVSGQVMKSLDPTGLPATRHSSHAYAETYSHCLIALRQQASC